MPISAEQWRVKTGMINASRGFRQHSIKPPQSLCDLPIPPPPSDWKGYSLALTLMCLPLLYKIYALGAAVMMYLVRGENYGLVTQDSYGMIDTHLHHGHWSGVLLLLLSITSYLTMTLAAFLMSVHEYRERNNYQLVLIHPLHHLKLLCWFNMEGGAGGGLQMVPKIVNGCVYTTLVMDPPSTLQCVRTSVQTVNRKATGISVTFVSFVLQLSTIALAMLLLLGGDVERNPGPSLGVDDITTLVHELKPATSKYFDIGLHLGIKPEKIETIKLDHSGTEDRLRTILLFWLRGNTAVKVCWESIIKALIKVDRKELARDLELMEKYCPNEKETLFGALQYVRCTPSTSMKSTKTTFNIGNVFLGILSSQFILQLSTLVVAMLLLLAGDVERNPGPVTELTMEDHQEVCDFLKNMNPNQLRELGGILGLHYANLTRMNHLPAEMVAAWLRAQDNVLTKSGHPSWESLVKALKKAQQNGIASNIEKVKLETTTDYGGNQVSPQIVPQQTSGQMGKQPLAGATAAGAQQQNRGSQATHTTSDHVTEVVTYATQQRGGKIPIPVLDTSLLDDTQKQRCQKMSAEMDKLSEKFQDLFGSISASLEEREIPVTKIVLRIRTFQAFEPVYATDDSRSILEHRISELTNAKSIDEVMIIIGAYFSFFNYHLLKRLVEKLGTEDDLKMLSDYEEEYRLFAAECMVYECPTRFQGPTDEQTQRTFMVKVDDAFENCTLSHLKRFINKLSEVLKLSEGTLSLESIRRGCLELTLQAPLFVYQNIFPLSSDQERALAALGVIKISAGDYQYPHSQDEGDNDDNGKPDDGSGPDGGRGDSGIGTLTTIPSEMSELSEELVWDSHNPYAVDYVHKSRKETIQNSNQEITALHIAAYQGNLGYVKMLVNSGMFIPSQSDEKGYTALHYAVRGGQLDVLKYFIEEQQCNPSDVGAFGETPLHLACRRGDLETVKYLVVEQQVDPMCQDKEYGVTPFHSACGGGNIDIVRLLLKEMSVYVSTKEIVEEKTKHGLAPVHIAALEGHLTVVRYIFSELKCDPNIRGQHGMTPLHVAAFKGHVDIVKYFINTVQCDPSLTDDRKRTPLFLAAESKNLATVKFLSKEKKGSNAMHRDYNGDTPLHMAAFSGEIEVIKYFVSELKCDPNAKNKDGATPLHAAAQEGHIQVMEYFIDEKECSPLVKDNFGVTPLYSATEKGHLNVVKFLTTKKHWNPLLKSHLGNTPLHISAANGHLDIVKFLITELKCDPNLPGQEGSTPLHVAALKGHVEVMKFLLNESNCIRSPKNDSGLTPLHYAAREGHLDAVKLLTVDHHCDPNCRDSTQSTPLHYAVRAQQNEVIDFFINDLNCDPNTVGPLGLTPLHIAVESGNLETVKVLLKNKKCSPTGLYGNGVTPLHVAAFQGHLNIMKFLISDYSCDPSARGEQGVTPLHMAASGGHVHVMKYLVIDKQCDPSLLDNTKSTPLHCAAKGGHLEAVKFLTVDENCDPCCKDQDKDTPLHLAAANGRMDVVKFLVSELKCNPHVTNNNGLTPRQTASGQNEISEYLKSAEKHSSVQKPKTRHESKHHDSPPSHSQDPPQRTYNYTFQDMGKNTLVTEDATEKSAMGRHIYSSRPPKPISTTLKEGDDPLQNVHYFPPFRKLPEEREFNKYYKRRDGVNWLFMAEITNSDNSQISGFGYRNETLVSDRSGRDNIPIYFHHDPILERNFTFSTLKKGHTLIVQQATQHHFRDGTIGLRIELLSTLLVIPCSMKDLFTLSELYYKCKDTQCWSCGKTQTGATSPSPEESVSKTTAAAETLKKCGVCKVARYCSKECQATDWKTRHRRLCKLVIPHFMKLTQL